MLASCEKPPPARGGSTRRLQRYCMRRLAQIDLQPTPIRRPLTGHLAPEKETRRNQPNSRLERVIHIEYKEEMMRNTKHASLHSVLRPA
jgi:hypothetical protein